MSPLCEHDNPAECPNHGQPALSGSDRAELQAALTGLSVAIGCLMRTNRPGWADELARIRNAIEKVIR